MRTVKVFAKATLRGSSLLESASLIVHIRKARRYDIVPRSASRGVLGQSTSKCSCYEYVFRTILAGFDPLRRMYLK